MSFDEPDTKASNRRFEYLVFAGFCVAWLVLQLILPKQSCNCLNGLCDRDPRTESSIFPSAPSASQTTP